MRIAVFCPNLVGDAVMASPTLRALRRGWPEARIVGIMKPAVAATLAGSPRLDDLILSDPKSARRERRFASVARRLRAERFDLAVLLPNSIRSALMARLGGIRRRVGYARGGRGLLLTDGLDPPRDERGRFVPVPIVEYYLGLVRHLGAPVDSLACELFTTPEEEKEADRAWRHLGIDGAGAVVCLNTGGAFGPAKNWPIEHFAALARRLVETLPVRVLVVCGPAERDSARTIAERVNHPGVVSLADEAVSIGLTKASVRRSALLITTDSGPRHFAAGFGVPVVSLFGPTHIAWTRTQHPLAIHLQQPVPCGPCQRPECHLGHHRCMVELHPEAVFEAARRLLESPRRSVA